jgi:flagellar basal body-associated protein FliL
LFIVFGRGRPEEEPKGVSTQVSILWIILIVVLVLVLLGFFSRGW